MSDMLLQALKKKLEGDVAVAKANIMIYKEKSVGIGEHPEIVQAIENCNEQKQHEIDFSEFGSGNSDQIFLDLLLTEQIWNVNCQKQFQDLT